MMQILALNAIAAMLPTRSEQSHKASFGHVFNVAGSINYPGAAYLSSISALRVGAGYVTLASSLLVCQRVAAQSPDLVFLPLPSVHEAANDFLPSESAAQILSQLKRVNTKLCSMSIGSGLGRIAQTARVADEAHTDNYAFFCALLHGLQQETLPIVLDADGLNFLSRKPLTLPENCLLTPHPKELSRLLAVSVAHIQADRVKYAQQAALQFNAIVVLKGANTVITDGKRVFINPTGNSALAKAGTGDVLTGMITGFCAQGVSPLNAACLGVYLHGLAGDIAALALSPYSMLASDLINFIPKALIRVLQAKYQN
ncbi:NAD(P)H-hydrate dehydratase [Shewanella denitrificans]|nr:NAD(P)H-hydrate dehydratase [Shewanella denitrificans]